MEVKVNMLNVKDGDAIIIELIKQDKTLVMVIDGGESGYYLKKMKPKLETVLKKYNKKAPDVVVCTHYDSDHIGGLIPLIQDYINDIQQVWIHTTSDSIDTLLVEAADIKNNGLKLMKLYKEVNLDKELLLESQKPVELIEENKQFLVESLDQLDQLIKLIPPAKLKQVYHKQRPLTDWPEIMILGPTFEYYKKLFPKSRTLKSLILEELQVSGEMSLSEKIRKEIIDNPCDKLKNDRTAKITTVNKASIIIAIDNDEKRYLFTGDAGLESFKNIPNWENELKDIYFLKVPHHGSNYNMSKEMAQKMNPQYAYCSGDTYQDDEVIECLAQKTKDKIIKTTKADGDLYFDK